jgi:hypothetical protein
LDNFYSDYGAPKAAKVQFFREPPPQKSKSTKKKIGTHQNTPNSTSQPNQTNPTPPVNRDGGLLHQALIRIQQLEDFNHRQTPIPISQVRSSAPFLRPFGAKPSKFNGSREDHAVIF